MTRTSQIKIHKKTTILKITKIIQNNTNENNSKIKYLKQKNIQKLKMRSQDNHPIPFSKKKEL